MDANTKTYLKYAGIFIAAMGAIGYFTIDKVFGLAVLLFGAVVASAGIFTPETPEVIETIESAEEDTEEVTNEEEKPETETEEKQLQGSDEQQ